MGCQPHQGAGYFEVSDEKKSKVLYWKIWCNSPY
jgi:hypothetical protein